MLPPMQTAVWLLLGLAAVAVRGDSAIYTPSGPILNATDWANWLTAQSAAGQRQLVLAPGTYNVTAPVPPATVHVTLPPLANVAVDCSGVTLVMQDRRAGAVYLTGWTNVSLSGLSVRYALPPSNTAQITAVNASSPSQPTVDVVVPAGFPTDDWDAGTVTTCDAFDAGSRLQKRATWDLEVTAIRDLPPGPRTYRLTLGNIGQLDNVAAGDLLGCRVVGGQMTVHVDNSENSTFTGITLYGGPVFGFFHTGSSAVGARGGNVFDGIAIRYPDPPPGSPAGAHPPLSTSADGFHCAGVPWGPTIRNAAFEGMNDDGIAIHGTFLLVVDGSSAAGAADSIIIGSPWGTSTVAVGDTITLYDPTLAPQPPLAAPAYQRSAYNITSLRLAPTGYAPPYNVSRTLPHTSLAPGALTYIVLTLAAPGNATTVPPGVGFDWVVSDVSRTGDGFALINNTIVNHRARGMLIKASNGVIAGNTIVNSSLGGIIITPELGWGEADFAHNLLVVNNTIDAVARAQQGYGGIAVAAVAPNGAPGQAPGHGNITVANNTITDTGYAPIWVTSAGGVTLAGNRIVRPFPAAPAAAGQPPTLPTCCEPVPNYVTVWADAVAGLRASDNCVQPAPANSSSMASIFNVTATVTGSFTGGVQLC